LLLISRLEMPRKQRSIQEKLAILDEIPGASIRSVAKKHGISPQNIRQWIRNRDLLRKSSGNRQRLRLPGAGRNVKSEALDGLLYEQILFETKEKNCVTRQHIIQWAMYLKNSLQVNINVSSGWLEKFIQRHHLIFQHGEIKPTTIDDQIIEDDTTLTSTKILEI